MRLERKEGRKQRKRKCGVGKEKPVSLRENIKKESKKARNKGRTRKNKKKEQENTEEQAVLTCNHHVPPHEQKDAEDPWVAVGHELELHDGASPDEDADADEVEHVVEQVRHEPVTV